MDREEYESILADMFDLGGAEALSMFIEEYRWWLPAVWQARKIRKAIFNSYQERTGRSL